MFKKHQRLALVLGLITAIVVSLAVFGGASTGRLAWTKAPKLNSDPDRVALGAKGQSLAGEPVGRNHEGLRTPVTLAQQQLIDRAYPATTLPVAWQQGALNFFLKNIKSRAYDNGKASWQLAGPSTGTYPAVLNRTNADYVASGRVTALAITPTCTAGDCRAWVAAAGGGIWRTDDALASNVSWTYMSGGFATNAIGTLTYDAPSHTLFAGTGEQNASADSEAGVGIYSSTDGGSNWTLVAGSAAMSAGNSISSIVIDHAHPGTLYVGTTFGVRGIAGIGGGAQPSYVDPTAPKPGLWKSTDSGNTFSLIYDDSLGAWGVNHVELDSHGVIYIGAIAEGIQRSSDGGNTWEHVFTTQDPGGRTEFALNTVGTHTRIYVGDGGNETGKITTDGASYESTSGVYRGDDIDTKTAAQLTDGTHNAGYAALTTFDRTQPGYLTYDYCWGQCWYDNFVLSPAGHPDTVYVLGAYNYDFPTRNNGRTVLLSTDAGTHWWDQTADKTATDGTQNGIHPDQHALVVNPANPLQFFEGSDGGVVRSSGELVDGSDVCDHRGINPASPSLIACRNSLAQIPTHIDSLNAGLSTLQFQTVSVNPANSKDVQGGTQDNGTWEGTAGNQDWPQTMYGDGGVSAFDVGNPSFRMNEFYDKYTDVNFQGGNVTKWVIVSAPFFAANEASAFYKPQISDPAVSGTLFVGLDHVWRTKDFGGDQATLEANCPEFTAAGNKPGCGDFVALGDPSGHGGTTAAGSLTAAGVYGTDKAGGYVVAVARTASDTSTMWAATRRGRVFITKNVDATNPGSVTFSRIDAGANLAAGSAPTPRRFVSGIVIDPKNTNHAFVSFGGYNAATDGVTPAAPGHVFDVLVDPTTGKATWTSLDQGNGPLGDMPINSLALDEKTNRLYVGTDFGVLSSVGRSGVWRPAAAGMPMVAVSGLTLDSKNRVLYAATHGRAVWSLQLNN
jgi:hypothetical protein